MIDVREVLARHSQRVWIGCMAAAVLALAAGGARWRELTIGQSSRSLEIGQLNGAVTPDSQSVTPTAPSAEAFVTSLPATIGAEVIVQRLAASARRQGVTLTSSRVQTAGVESIDELKRSSLALTLRGPYPAVKATLGDMLPRTKHATLQSLNIRRQSAPEEVEAQAVLSLWSRP